MVGHSIDLAAGYPVEKGRVRQIVDHYATIREPAMAKARENGDENDVYWELAWQIFDEVNANWSHIKLHDVHPLDHYADLSGLALEEARGILTQKLVDLAECAQAYPTSNQMHGPRDYVMTVKVPSAVHGVVDMVANEIGLDMHYVDREKLLLCHLTPTTLTDCPVLLEW